MYASPLIHFRTTMPRHYDTIPIGAIRRYFGYSAADVVKVCFPMDGSNEGRAIYFDKKKVNVLFRAKCATSGTELAPFAALACELARQRTTHTWETIVVAHLSPAANRHTSPQHHLESAYSFMKTAVDEIVDACEQSDFNAEDYELNDEWPSIACTPMCSTSFDEWARLHAAEPAIPSGNDSNENANDESTCGGGSSSGDDEGGGPASFDLDAFHMGENGPHSYHRIYVNANVVECVDTDWITIKIGYTKNPLGGDARLSDAHAGEFANLFNFTMCLLPGEAAAITRELGKEYYSCDPVEGLFHRVCRTYQLQLRCKRVRHYYTQREIFRVPRQEVGELIQGCLGRFPLSTGNSRTCHTHAYDESGLQRIGGWDGFLRCVRPAGLDHEGN